MLYQALICLFCSCTELSGAQARHRDRREAGKGNAASSGERTKNGRATQEDLKSRRGITCETEYSFQRAQAKPRGSRRDITLIVDTALIGHYPHTVTQ